MDLLEFFKFIGYVLCFWVLWRIYDYVFPNLHCKHCNEKNGKINSLLEEKATAVLNAQLLEKTLKSLENDVGKLQNKLVVAEQRTDPNLQDVVNLLNKADVGTLKSILGQKSKKISVILAKRPFASVYDAELKIGIRTMATVVQEMRKNVK